MSNLVSSKVKQGITKQFIKVLEDRNYPYTESAVNKIIETFLQSKASLIKLLSKHPNWNSEKLLIQFDEDYSREFNRTAIIKFVDWLAEAIRRSNKYYTGVDRQVDYFIRYEINSQFFNPDMKEAIDKLNYYNENFKLRTNMKSSKAILKICKEMEYDKLPALGELYNSTKERPRYNDFNYQYAMLCDNINPIKVRRHTCISLNPVDFLLMSHGTSWKSCHYIDYFNEDPGCYSSGTISYLLDECSFLFYTVDASFDGKDIELEKKVQRQVFGYRDEVFVQSRLYPQSMDTGAEAVYTDIRNVVQKVIADCLEVPNLWTRSTSTSDLDDIVEHGENATCYPDWDSYESRELCSISRIKGTTKFPKIILGAQPICISCGYRHSEDGNINCCGSGYTCDKCGDRIYNEEDTYDVNGGTYCRDCIIICEDCGEYELAEDALEVWGWSRWDRGRASKFVCSCCAEEYRKCDCCGNYWHETDMVETVEGNWYCEECDDHYAQCDECGDYYSIDNTIYDDEDDMRYCRDCFRDKIEEKEEELERMKRLLND